MTLRKNTQYLVSLAKANSRREQLPPVATVIRGQSLIE